MEWGLAGPGNSSAVTAAPWGVGVKVAKTHRCLETACEKIQKTHANWSERTTMTNTQRFLQKRCEHIE